jgi:hypothetical protein
MIHPWPQLASSVLPLLHPLTRFVCLLTSSAQPRRPRPRHSALTGAIAARSYNLALPGLALISSYSTLYCSASRPARFFPPSLQFPVSSSYLVATRPHPPPSHPSPLQHPSHLSYHTIPYSNVATAQLAWPAARKPLVDTRHSPDAGICRPFVLPEPACRARRTCRSVLQRLREPGYRPIAYLAQHRGKQPSLGRS